MNGLASWVCGHCTWKEELEVHSKFSEHDDSKGVVLSENRVVLGNMPGWPDLEYWSDLVESYNTRSLTFESDALDAFAGVAEALTHVFPGGFYCGLPEMFFDIALLWQPRSRVRRRNGRAKESGAGSLPSWSWAGWASEIDTRIGKTSREFYCSDYSYGTDGSAVNGAVEL